MHILKRNDFSSLGMLDNQLCFNLQGFLVFGELSLKFFYSHISFLDFSFYLMMKC